MKHSAEAFAVTVGMLAASCRCGGARKPPARRGAERPVPTTPAPASAARVPEGGAPAETSASTVEAAPRLAPLSASAPLVELAVESHRAAVVSLPLGATEKRPVVVALHGNYDRPEWQCDVWRNITAGFPFVLCPRGIPRRDAPRSEERWEYGGLRATEDELERGLEALGAAYPEYVDDGPVLFTGFSLGAILGVHLLRKHPERYPRAILTEGGYKGWSRGIARLYGKGGGERVLFACGQWACKSVSRRSAAVLEKEGVGAKVVFGGNVGHTYDGKVADAIAAEWAWLVAGDERWRVAPDR